MVSDERVRKCRRKGGIDVIEFLVVSNDSRVWDFGVGPTD
jgi:hypothetical protein